ARLGTDRSSRNTVRAHLGRHRREVIKVERKSCYIAPRPGIHGDLNRDKLSIALNLSALGDGPRRS
ncbi:MAG: hypothetical protein ACLQU2_21925, partial [Candidatus Binataceae bacterium]